MASVIATALLGFLLVVALQPMATPSSLLPPILAPAFDNVCEQAECGQGKCQPSTNSTIFYDCVCYPGWMQTISDDNNQFKFLPCVIPNCTLNYSCMAAPSPVQKKSSTNLSIFDICHWTNCGGGSCNRTSNFSYSCECDPGYYNLLNTSAFPCYNECAIGLDCANLGISQSPPPAPALADDGKNQAGSNFLRTYYLLALLMLSLVLVLQN
ncbi:uncharacterized protein LOC123220411 [Mangifera indica]|uniref:uncharacterized protein LOC123220411 n=1 Tax=Mangifera indica TaxID=29780 RepID=UPI001CFC447C|nr:uncharacterized protein LOC123220411 [Mangifera indica]